MGIFWGTIVNAIAIMVGGALGLKLPVLPKGIRTTVMQGMGLVLIILGMQMAIKTEQILLLVGSLVAGGMIGEWIGIEARLEQLGRALEKRFGRDGGTPFAAGFVPTTLIYCVGAMAILGSIDGGVRQDHAILYTKSMLDGFSAIIFASTLGVGVLFSAFPVFLYQGLIALCAALFASQLDPTQLAVTIREMSAVGGALIIGIGINILEIKTIRVGNLLPSIAIAAGLAWVLHIA